MQRQHQQRLHANVNSDFQFQQFQLQPAADYQMKKTSQVAKAMTTAVPESRKSSYSQHQLPQQQQQQDSALGTERLTSLHAKLHQEADKIRKWKVQTEMDMKHKDKKLNEANITVEVLRKSILELQLENEKLSSKLQDELGSRDEVAQRIHHTRDLIGALKSQEEKLEEKLASCETERTELKYLEKEHAHQFEEMIAKFRKLEVETRQDHETLVNKVQQEQEQRQSLQKVWQTKVVEAEDQIKSLGTQVDEKNVELREVHLRLLKSDEKLHSTDIQLGDSQLKVTCLAEDLDSRQKEMEKFKNSSELLEKEKEELKVELAEEKERAEALKQQEDSVQEALNNSVAIFNQRQGDMQRNIDLIKSELSDEQNRLREAKAQLTESLMFNESLKSSRDVLLMEKTEMEVSLDHLKVELTDLQSDKYKNKADISFLETEVESLRTHLHEEQQASSRLQVMVDEINPRYAALEKEKKLLQKELKDLKDSIEAHKRDLQQTQQAHGEGSKQNQQLQESLAQLKAQLEEKTFESEKFQQEIVKGQQQISAQEGEMATNCAQLQQATAKVQELSEEQQNTKTYISELEAQLTSFGEEKVELENQLVVLEREKQLLQQQQEETGLEMQTEQTNQKEACVRLGEKLKEVNAEMKAKNKATKDLEKELKSLRTKLTNQEKKQEERCRELDFLKQELAKNEEAREHGDKVIASLQTHLEQETHKTEEQAKKMRHLEGEVAQAQKEKSEALLQSERQIIEMTSTLEKYTNDHQKLLAQKDKEIEDLGSHNSHLTQLNQQNNQNAKDGQVESHQLTEQLTLLKAEKEQLEKNKISEIETLKTQLSIQEKLVEELKENSLILTEQLSRTAEQYMEVEGQLPPSMPTTPRAQIRSQSPENAQRSILRQTGSASKRRKVAFISPSVDVAQTRDSDSDSSIELEIEEPSLQNAGRASHTPLRLRQSPHGKKSHVISSPMVFTPNKYSKPGALIKKSKQQSHPSHNTSSPEPAKVKEKEFQKVPNMRKAPMRTSKFFRSSPKERTVIKKKQDEAKERLSWFDDDAVYGFGSED